MAGNSFMRSSCVTHHSLCYVGLERWSDVSSCALPLLPNPASPSPFSSSSPTFLILISLAAGFPLFANAMYTRIGTVGAGCVLGALCALMMSALPLPLSLSLALLPRNLGGGKLT